MNAVQIARARSIRATYFNIGTLPFWGVHIAAIVGVALVGFSTAGIVWAAAAYAVGMFFVTGGYHRYFSHRAYKTSRPFQFLLGLGCTLTIQKGPLWWAHHHRHHHRHSDDPQDLHSPAQSGFWWSHIGWILSDDFEATDYAKIKDFAKYPELVWLDKYHLVPPVALAVLLYLVGGPVALVWGFFVSISLLWHGTFTINSLTHVWGVRRYQTTDDSRNNFLLALITHGEGWHNNHHFYQSSARQGWRWYQIDVSYYVLKLLSLPRLVWDLRPVPEHVREGRLNDKALELAAQIENTDPRDAGDGLPYDKAA